MHSYGPADSPSAAPPSWPSPPADSSPPSLPPASSSTVVAPTPSDQRSSWVGRSGGVLLLVAGALLGFSFLYIAFQIFALSSLVSSIQSSSPPTSANAASRFHSILEASGTGVVFSAIAVLLVGPANFLSYFQKSKTGHQYTGDGLLVVGRFILAIAVIFGALYVWTVAGAITASSSNSTPPSVGFPSLQISVEYILVFIIVGGVLGMISRSFLSELRNREGQISRKDRFQSISAYTRVAGLAMLAIGAVLCVVAVYSSFGHGNSILSTGGGVAGTFNLLGYGFLFFAVWGFVSGVGEMFHAVAYAQQPVTEQIGPSPVPASSPT